MTAARRIVTAGVAVLAILAGSDNRPLKATASSHAPPAQAAIPVAEFVANIRPDTSVVFSSRPSDMAVFQDALYFAADDGVTGRELWRLGTTGLPTLVADINLGAGGSVPERLTVAGDTLYFLATTASTGQELWRYDGTGGPTLVADLYPGTGSGVPSVSAALVAFGNEVVFQGRTDISGDELFAFDGTNLKEFDIYPDEPFCAPGCSSDPYGLTVYNGAVYFGAGDRDGGVELFRYNGTSFPQRLTNIVPGAGHAFPEWFTGVGNRLVFAAYGADGRNQLYSYDIVAGGEPTKLVTGAAGFGAFPQNFASDGIRAYFSADDPTTGRELWMTDGTQPGTALVEDLNPNAASSLPNTYAVFNGEVYFTARDPNVGNEIRATNGSTIRLLEDINPGAAGTSWDFPTVFGGFLVFTPNGSQLLTHPWFTTGTPAGTDVVRKSDGTLIYTLGAVDDPDYTFFNGALYFAAFDSVHGSELWRITMSATEPTATTLTSSPNPSIVGDLVTFTATVSGANPTGTVTFFDDVTPLGTVALVGTSASLDVSSLGVGLHTITASYSGDAAFAPSTSTGLVQTVNPIPTATTLISSLNPSVFNQSVTFTATVTGGTPTGDVTFLDGVTPLATVTLVGNMASFVTQTLSTGSHTITAIYEGDATHATSTSNAVPQTVGQAITTTTLTSAPNPSDVNELVMFSAVVSGGVPVGNIVFSEGALTLATVPIVGNAAAFQTSTLTTGSHTITATYAGDANHVGSSGNVVHVVNDPSPPTPPIADSQDVIVSEDAPRPITLTGSDVNNDPLTFFVVTQPIRGTLSGTLPDLIYTPELNYSGLDSFSFKANDGTADSALAVVRITVTPVNDPPVAANDAYSTPEDTALVITAPGVLANDSDVVEGSPLTAILVTGPVHGTLALAATGAFTYTPFPGVSGPDTFTYRANDGELNSNIVTVTITVTPVNDPPMANNDSYTTAENVPLTIALPGVLSNDTDPEGVALTAALATGPANGALILNANGSFTYTPASNFAGSDSFTYRASDGVTASAPATVSITVVPKIVTWTPTGTLGARRRYHAATLLANGQVLVTGGYGQGNGVLSSAELYDPNTGIWSATGNMRVRRAFHTATLLPNGHVLVAGGESNGFVTRTETYDPQSGTWSEAGTLNTLHSRHTATLLPNGSVLVVGGYNNAGSLTGAELYDPFTRAWSITGSLSVGRHIHTATLLPGGKVLAAGGYGNNGGMRSVEIYDSALGSWTTLANLTTDRTGHTATLLANGRVLVAGGGNNNTPTLASAELFDPASGIWSPAASLSAARIEHSATLLPSGRILIAGGLASNTTGLASSELYDPTTGQWSPTASLVEARWAHTATLLPDGRVLGVGGIGGGAVLASAELYGPPAAPSVGTWSAAASPQIQRWLHTATRLADGRVLVAGGDSAFAGGGLASAEIFDPATGSWTTTGNLVVPRANHVAVLLLNGKVLVAGGGNSTGAVSGAELYDPATGTWSVTGGLSTGRVAPTATLLFDGRVLIVGGFANDYLGTAEIYNPATGSWSSTGGLTAGRTAHKETLLSDGKVLITGGFGNGGNGYLNSAAIYDPSTGLWTNTANLGSRRAYHTATRLPDGRVLVAGGYAQSGASNTAEVFNPATGAWTSTGGLSGKRGGHTASLLLDGSVVATGGLGSTADLSTTEVYSPLDGSWTARGNLASPRNSHTATLLLNGKVLVVGGISNGVILATAELYTP